MTAVAGDVPSKFDVVINGEGYLHADVQDVKGEYGYTPTFVTRQNTQGDYGDNQQDFWLTATQRDWSLGEQQRYFRVNDDDGKRRFWSGRSIDVSTPGQVNLNLAPGSLTFAASAITAGVYPAGASAAILTSTKLYKVDKDGTITDKGSHGLGGSPTRFGIATDGGYVYFTDATTIRKFDGATFSSFSASPGGPFVLAFLNNTLYGYNGISLFRYDTAGAATTLFQWKGAEGSLENSSGPHMIPFGGKLLILRNSVHLSELWLYDGTAPSLVARLPGGFGADQLCESMGTVFISGLKYDRAAIMYYSNGTIGTLWEDVPGTPTVSCPLASHNGGLAFYNYRRSDLMFYNPSVGGVSCIATASVGSTDPLLVSVPNLLSSKTPGTNTSFLIGIGSSTAGYYWPTSTYASSGTVTESLFDFDSSLTKLFRGIKVEFDPATDGNGGSVDISYRVGDVDGSYTSLQTGATSGTEYTLTGISGRSLSVKLTLNKGTSTSGPVLKRDSVRAVGIETGFKKFTLVLQLSGTKALDGQMMQLRDGRPHTKSGEEMADNLFTAAAATAPFAVTTELHGTIPSCVIDQENFKVQRIRKNEYIAYVPVREV